LPPKIPNIYSNPVITEDRDRSVAYLEKLFDFYLQTPDSMPSDHEQAAAAASRYLVVCDYIAGMTDQFLLKQCRDHFGD
jgi:dGTP triphosphohydrolase